MGLDRNRIDFLLEHLPPAIWTVGSLFHASSQCPEIRQAPGGWAVDRRTTNRFLMKSAPLPPCPSCVGPLLPTELDDEVLNQYIQHGRRVAEAVAGRRRREAEVRRARTEARAEYVGPNPTPFLRPDQIAALVPLAGSEAWVRAEPPDRSFHGDLECESIRRRRITRRQMLTFSPSSIMIEAFKPCLLCHPGLAEIGPDQDSSESHSLRQLIEAAGTEERLDEALGSAWGRAGRIDPVPERRFTCFERAAEPVETRYGWFPSVVFYTAGSTALGAAFHRTVQCTGLISGRRRYQSRLEMTAVHPEHIAGSYDPCGICLKP